MTESKTLWLGFLVCAATGATLLISELLMLALADRSWHSLGPGAVVTDWIAAVVAFGAAGVALTFRGGHEARIPRAAAASGLVGLTAMLVFHLEKRWIPGAPDWRGVLLTVAALGILALLWRRLIEPLTSTAALILGGPVRTLAVLTTPLLVGLIATSLVAWPAPINEWTPSTSSLEHEGGMVDADPPRLLILGIDGARWSIIDPLLRSGRMPHLASLVRRGRRGVLKSRVDSASPIVWTTIFTGKPPEEHGISDWSLTSAENRRVKAIWNILDELGWTSYVVNVPGSFPADTFRAGMLAGFPLPLSVSTRSLAWANWQGGWRVISGNAHAEFDRRLPVEVPLRRDLESGTRVPVALFTPSESILERTLLFEVATKLLQISSRSWARKLTSLTRQLTADPLRSRVRFELELYRPPQGSGWRIRGFSDSREEPLFDLAPGEWGPWLAVEVRDARHLVRPKAIDVGPAATDLFFTAFYEEAMPGLASPPVLTLPDRDSPAPYVAEAMGWYVWRGVFRDTGKLRATEEHLRDLSNYRATTSLRIMASRSWDAFIHVFTLTDRAQHVFWRFREPEPYRAPALQHMAPTPDQVQEFRGAVNRSYELVDSWIGEMLAQVTDSTLVVVLSDHGAQSGHHQNRARGIHHEDGIYLVAGPTIPPLDLAGAAPGPNLEHEDILPLILAHLGIPQAEDMNGRIPHDLLPRGKDGTPLPPAGLVETYESAATLDGVRDPREIDEAVREQLRSLGYLE